MLISISNLILKGSNFLKYLFSLESLIIFPSRRIYSVCNIDEEKQNCADINMLSRNVLSISTGLILAESNIHSQTAIMLLRKKPPYTTFVGII